MKKWQKYSIIGVAAALVLGLVIWGCVALWPDPVGPIITAPTETTEPVLAATVPDTTAPVETEPMETTVPVTEPEVTHGEETQPEETVPETTHGEEVTEPAETTPKETQPKETTPKETQPKPTEPKETQPKPTDPPKPTEPKETEPKETQPKPTEPKPTEPKPTDPPKPTEPKNEHPACDGPWEHAFVETYIKATCTEQGYIYYECVSCGYSYKDSYTPALGGSHSYEVKKVVDPTGISKGYTVYQCSKCGHEYKDNFVDPLPPETIDIAALEEYGRQYAASLGYTPSTVPGFNNNAGYFPPLLHTILTMEDGKAAARSAVDYQYKCDIGAGYGTDCRINVRFISNGNPNEYYVYCFYGGE